MTVSQLPPHDQAAEEATIGALLIDRDAMQRILEVGLTPIEFHDINLARIFSAMLALHQRQQPVDFILVCSELKQRSDLERIGGAAYITQLVDRCPTSIHAALYASIIRRCSLQRAYLVAAADIAQAAYDGDGTPAGLQEHMARIWQEATRNGKEHSPAGSPVAYSLQDILDTFGDPGHDIVQAFIPPKAVIAFSGHGGVGKGFTLLDLAFPVSQGFDWLDLLTCKTNVLIVDLENRGPWLRRRILQVMGGHGLELPPENVRIVTSFRYKLTDPGFVSELVALAESVGAGLIILDSLIDFLGDLDENSNSDMGKVAEKLRAVRDATGATIIVQHHVSKASAGKSYQTSRGASSFFDGVDVDIQVMRDGPQLIMEHKKNRLGIEMRIVARMNWGPGTFNLSPVSTKIGRPQRSGQGDKDETAILDLLESGQWWPSNALVTEVRQVTNHTRSTIHSKLRLLVTDAKLERRDNGSGIPYQVRLISEQDDDHEQG